MGEWRCLTWGRWHRSAPHALLPTQNVGHTPPLVWVPLVSLCCSSIHGGLPSVLTRCVVRPENLPSLEEILFSFFFFFLTYD